MPRKTYMTQAAYDEDYRFAWPAVNEALPAATLAIDGADIAVTPMWSRPKVGGYLTLEGDLPFTLGVGPVTSKDVPHPARIAAIAGNAVTLEVSTGFTGTFAVAGEAGYHVPQMMLTGSNPAIMRRVWAPRILELIELLKGFTTPLLPSDDVLIVGSGFAWEAETWITEGYNAIGVDTSPFVHANKAKSYQAEYRAILAGAGLDPDQGEGADLLALWMVDGRTAAIVLDADINAGQGRKAVGDAFGLAGNAKVKWAYTSFVLPILDDGEAVSLNDNMIGIADNVFHYTPLGGVADGSGSAGQLGDPAGSVMNWKSLVQWKTLLSPSNIIDPHFQVM